MNATDSPPRTWEEAAEKESRLVLAEYRDRLQRSPLSTFDEALDKRFDELCSAVENDDTAWKRIEFRHLASVALVGYVAASNARVKEAMDKVVTTIALKQHDYGYDNIAGFGSQGLVVRISDKRARLRNLKKRGAPANEPLLDTWLDIVGYCIVGLMWEAGTFSLPLAADQVTTVDLGHPSEVVDPASPFARDDLAEIRAIVDDTVIGGVNCNAWARGVVSEQLMQDALVVAGRITDEVSNHVRAIAREEINAKLQHDADKVGKWVAERAESAIRKYAREEIEAWHTEARATNAPQTEGERTPPRVQHLEAPDLKGRDHPTVRNP